MSPAPNLCHFCQSSNPLLEEGPLALSISQGYSLFAAKPLPCEYMVDVAAWWNMIKWDVCVSDCDAQDNCKYGQYLCSTVLLFPNGVGSIAKFALGHLTSAAESGNIDSGLELYQIHKYLASRYEKARGHKKDMLKDLA
jgi:hypothetical protein